VSKRGKDEGRPVASAPDVRHESQSGLQLGFGTQIALLVGIFVVVTGVADLAGAASLGVAAAIGQIAFALGLVALLLRVP
jgi:Flp pilus assembly protein TadB